MHTNTYANKTCRKPKHSVDIFKICIGNGVRYDMSNELIRTHADRTDEHYY